MVFLYVKVIACNMSVSPKNLEGRSLGSPSIPHSLKKGRTVPKEDALDTRSFQITISVPGDLSKDTIDKVVKWIKKNTDHAYVVGERGETDRLHLHAVVCFKESRVSSKIRENIWDRFVKPHHPDAKGSIAVKVQVNPGHKWYDDYLLKEREKIVYLDTYDRDSVTDYFPTQQVQEALMATVQLKNIAAPWIERDVEEWEKSTFTNDPSGALSYLKNRMYNLRNMVPISDKRKLTQKAYMYWEYRNRIVTPNAEESRLLNINDREYDYSVPVSSI